MSTDDSPAFCVNGLLSRIAEVKPSVPLQLRTSQPAPDAADEPAQDSGESRPDEA